MGGRTTVSQPQQHFFVNVVKPMVLATFWSPKHRFAYNTDEISTHSRSFDLNVHSPHTKTNKTTKKQTRKATKTKQANQNNEHGCVCFVFSPNRSLTVGVLAEFKGLVKVCWLPSVLRPRKLLLKPLVLQHFRKKMSCGCSAVVPHARRYSHSSLFFKK